MSKWINKDLFGEFQKEKIEEKDTSSGGFRRSDLLWETPAKEDIEFLTDIPLGYKWEYRWAKVTVYMEKGA